MNLFTSAFSLDTLLLIGILTGIALTSYLYFEVGTINISLDLHLLFGALGFVLASYYLNKTGISSFLILLLSLLSAYLFILATLAIFAVIVFTLKFDAVVSGLAINAFLLGIVLLIISIIGNTVVADGVATTFIDKNDYASLEGWTYSFHLLFAGVLLYFVGYCTYYFLWKTKSGFNIKMMQKSPKVFKKLGLSRTHYEYLIVFIGSFPMLLSVFLFTEYQPNFTGGFTGLGFLGLLIGIMAANQVIMIAFYAIVFGVIKGVIDAQNLDDKTFFAASEIIYGAAIFVVMFVDHFCIKALYGKLLKWYHQPKLPSTLKIEINV